MGFIGFVITAVMLIVGGLFLLYPTEMWAPAFILDLIPSYYHDKSIMNEVFTMHQGLWVALIIIPTVIFGGIKLVKSS
jgi:hypothetical protein